MRHDTDHPFPRVATVCKRSGVAKKPVPPAQPSWGQSPGHRLAASAHKDRTGPATKQFLRRDSSPAASALPDLRANWRLGSKSPQRLVFVKDCDHLTLQVAVLSGFPASPTSFFFQCPVSDPSHLGAASRRRLKHIPLAPENISHISHLTRSTTPRDGDGFSISVPSSLLEGVVQYAKHSEDTCLVGSGRGSCRKTDSIGCEIGRP